MNAFLRAHRVLAVKKQFVPDGENSFWTFCVEASRTAGILRTFLQDVLDLTPF